MKLMPRPKRWLALLLLAVLALLFVQSTRLFRWMYPIHYRETIQATARRYNLDPYLVAAVIQVESRYRPDRRSPKGAIGLMQIMPETAEWIAGSGRFGPNVTERLAEPDVNIEIGSRYLSMLIKEFDGNHAAALAAYNAGPGNVDRWLRQDQWDGRLETAERIPFGETRQYVQRVHYYWDKYHDVYGRELYEGKAAESARNRPRQEPVSRPS